MKNFEYKVKTIGKTNGCEIIAAGPLTKQPMTMLYRFVLLKGSGGFTVHREQFPDGINGKAHLSDGNYFKPDDFAQACEKFAERIKKDVVHFGSLYREE